MISATATGTSLIRYVLPFPPQPSPTLCALARAFHHTVCSRQLRADLGTDKLTYKGSGVLNFLSPSFSGSNPSYPSYTSWSDAECKAVMDWNGDQHE